MRTTLTIATLLRREVHMSEAALDAPQAEDERDADPVHAAHDFARFAIRYYDIALDLYAVTTKLMAGGQLSAAERQVIDMAGRALGPKSAKRWSPGRPRGARAHMTTPNDQVKSER